MSREVIYKDDTISFEFEVYDETTALIHCDVSDFTLKNLKQWYRLFPTAKKLLVLNGFKRMMTITPNPKFAQLFAGECAGKIQTPEGEREIFIWELV